MSNSNIGEMLIDYQKISSLRDFLCSMVWLQGNVMKECETCLLDFNCMHSNSLSLRPIFSLLAQRQDKQWSFQPFPQLSSSYGFPTVALCNTSNTSVLFVYNPRPSISHMSACADCWGRVSSRVWSHPSPMEASQLSGASMTKIGCTIASKLLFIHLLTEAGPKLDCSFHPLLHAPQIAHINLPGSPIERRRLDQKPTEYNQQN